MKYSHTQKAIQVLMNGLLYYWVRKEEKKGKTWESKDWDREGKNANEKKKEEKNKKVKH